ARQMESDEAIGAPANSGRAWSSGTFGRAEYDAGKPADIRGLIDGHNVPPRLEGHVRIEQPRDIETPAASASPVSQGTEPLPTREVLGALAQQGNYQDQSEPVVHVDGNV